MGVQLLRFDGGDDETVRAAAWYAEQDDMRALVQDTPWEGYEQVPRWIVEPSSPATGATDWCDAAGTVTEEQPL